MNGKHIFCFSLIILSVVMGLHWFKNKPKPKKKVSDRPRVALNLDDLQIQDEDPDGKKPAQDPENPDGTGDDPEDGTETDPKDPDATSNEDPENPPDQPDKPDVANASGTQSVSDTASGTSDLPPEFNDPVILAVKAIPRNPFEPSPYAKLVEKLRELEEKPDEEEVKKITELLRANFTATIKTRKELVAVIDSRLYRKGDLFQNRKITEIGAELVSIDTESKLFLIPKVGVEVSIASDGTYTFEDSYRKN